MEKETGHRQTGREVIGDGRESGQRATESDRDKRERERTGESERERARERVSD